MFSSVVSHMMATPHCTNLLLPNVYIAINPRLTIISFFWKLW